MFWKKPKIENEIIKQLVEKAIKDSFAKVKQEEERLCKKSLDLEALERRLKGVDNGELRNMAEIVSKEDELKLELQDAERRQPDNRPHFDKLIEILSSNLELIKWLKK